MNRSESKYFATAARMDEAFLSLLEKKDFEYITVKEICETAGVNRSTFYLHYETVGDLLAESAQHMFGDFIAHMKEHEVGILPRIRDCTLAELDLMTPAYLKPYLAYVRKNRRLFRTAMKNAVALRLDEAYDRLFRQIFVPILTRFRVLPEEQGYMMAFYIRGLSAIIDAWVKNDCADPEERVLSVMRRCVRPLPADPAR